jgi:hypothetical protein
MFSIMISVYPYIKIKFKRVNMLLRKRNECFRMNEFTAINP